MPPMLGTGKWRSNYSNVGADTVYVLLLPSLRRVKPGGHEGKIPHEFELVSVQLARDTNKISVRAQIGVAAN